LVWQNEAKISNLHQHIRPLSPELITEQHRPAIYRTIALLAFVLLQSVVSPSAERIKRKPLTDIEAARLASDQAMNDGTLHSGVMSSRQKAAFFNFADLGRTAVPISFLFRTHFHRPKRAGLAIRLST
jgi:hypothetical protein